jgi:hypothetical protein
MERRRKELPITSLPVRPGSIWSPSACNKDSAAASRQDGAALFAAFNREGIDETFFFIQRAAIAKLLGDVGSFGDKACANEQNGPRSAQKCVTRGPAPPIVSTAGFAESKNHPNLGSLSLHARFKKIALVDLPRL